jgi:flagellar protein FliO/FliZ
MGSTLYSLLMLGLVLGAIPASLWVLKRLQAIRPAGAVPRAMEVAAQVSLGPRERVVVLRMPGRELVLGVTAQQITLLAEQPATPREPQ